MILQYRNEGRKPSQNKGVITFVPLTWNEDFKMPGTHVPLITSFIGAVISILIAHFFKGIFKGKPKPAKA
jgi:hypothetical protein